MSREDKADCVVLQAGEKAGWLKRHSLSNRMPESGHYDFLDRRVPFVDAVFRSQTDAFAMDEAARLLHEAEMRHGVGIIDCPGIIVGCEGRVRKWEEKCLMPFLVETHLLISGSDHQQVVIYDANGCDQMRTFRRWGAIVADWADMEIRSSLFGPSWHYMSFYSDVPVNASEYKPWRDALFRVIDQKSRIYGWPFAPELSAFTAQDLKEGYWNHGKSVAIRGEAQPLPPPPTLVALELVARIGVLLSEHVDSNQLGRYYGPGTHFVLQEEPDTVIQSGGAYISQERGLPPKSHEDWMEAVPDLVIEARSPSDINRRLDTKICWWLEAGVRCL